MEKVIGNKRYTSDGNSVDLVATFTPAARAPGDPVPPPVSISGSFGVTIQMAMQEYLFKTKKGNWFIVVQIDDAGTMDLVPQTADFASAWLLFRGKTSEYDLYFGLIDA